MNNPKNQALQASRDPKECGETIDALRAIGFFDDGGNAFKQLHHQGGSATRFSTYSKSVEQFEEDGNNHRVHQRLMYVLLSCPGGAPPKGKSFQTLAGEAYQQIPPTVNRTGSFQLD